MPSWYRRASNGALVLAVHAQPGAKRTEVAGLHGDALKVRVAAPALEERANVALVAFLAERFAVPKRSVTLVNGDRSRDKRFEIHGSSIDAESLLKP